MEPYRHSSFSQSSTNTNMNLKHQRMMELYSIYSSDDEDDLVLSASAATVGSTSKGGLINPSSALPKVQHRSYTLTTKGSTDRDYIQGQYQHPYPDLPWNYMEQEDEDKETRESNDDAIKSQKMNQLSTTTKTNVMLNDMKQEIEKVPSYLTIQNPLFQQLIQEIQSQTTIHSKEQLRQIAILIHKVMIIETYDIRWTAYLKSGLGQLMSPNNNEPLSLSNASIWPKVIKKMVPIKNKHKVNENEIYSNFVQQQLFELNQQLKQYQMELNMKASHFQGYTLTVQHLIEKYVEQNLQSVRKEIKHEIELLQYDYHIQALKLEFFKQHPNQYQIKVMKQICESKYKQEATEQEYQSVNQQIHINNLNSQALEYSFAAQVLPLDIIEDVNTRQQFFDQFKGITEQTRANISRLYLTSAQDQREECKKKYEDLIRKMWSDHQLMKGNQKLSLLMIQLINQLCDQIGERTKCVYKGPRRIRS